ncbi:septum formation inhibitor Maf [Arthrobacter sp. MYb211]|uniref:Maf family protein n=1 Tax=unclassified Arthrobacter TaxID=235627 RepID=UPI000CFB77F8|nr:MULTISPECIES: nucleoside triphosphate pyrophosphatase [unclassified Arthrobacter]PRA13458.1 septum formation inhibitor Maf [Arthrobacter sp. MYb221]PRC10657.1 septum formation inhibitor Maf [Arthrobacter sp. MYb211]
MTLSNESARLLLASASAGRQKLLADAGLAFGTQVSRVDEDAVLAAAVSACGPQSPEATALLLARAKAENVAAAEHPEGTVVLGCDSVFELDGVAYGKPYTAEVARERWQQLSGATGILHSGHWLVDTADPQGARGRVSSTTVHFAEVSDEEIEAYVASGEPLPCAGAFTIDGLASAFIESIEGNFQNVVGLDIFVLRELLAEAGIPIVSLWK